MCVGAQKLWKEDPLICDNCGGRMHIISFITDRIVIDKILRHFGWGHQDLFPPRCHPLVNDNYIFHLSFAPYPSTEPGSPAHTASSPLAAG